MRRQGDLAIRSVSSPNVTIVGTTRVSAFLGALAGQAGSAVYKALKHFVTDKRPFKQRDDPLS
jgi:hypothetical protein